MSVITKRELIKGILAAAGGVTCSGIGALGLPHRELLSLKPGQLWLDTEGKPIQAHGASMLKVADTYYWYGENKELTTGANDIWTWGIRCYASRDLYNWTDIGIIIPQNNDRPESPLYYKNRWDRPHIIYNERSKKYVCWIKNLSLRGPQTRHVLTADKITGPWTVVRANMPLLGMSAGDFDLAVSHEDGKAYQIFERIHSEMIVADLDDDYTGITGHYSAHLPRHQIGLVREGPAHFVRNGKHYLITSGTTAYHPNPSEVAVADSIHGPWRDLGNLHRDDPSLTSFNSQISSVFKVPGKKDLYIALADRWNSNLEELAGDKFANGDAYRMFLDATAKVYEDGKILPPEQIVKRLSPEQLAYANATALDNVNTSRSTYVWLPLQFDGEKPFIEWKDEWKLSDYL